MRNSAASDIDGVDREINHRKEFDLSELHPPLTIDYDRYRLALEQKSQPSLSTLPSPTFGNVYRQPLLADPLGCPKPEGAPPQHCIPLEPSSGDEYDDMEITVPDGVRDAMSFRRSITGEHPHLDKDARRVYRPPRLRRTRRRHKPVEEGEEDDEEGLTMMEATASRYRRHRIAAKKQRRRKQNPVPVIPDLATVPDLGEDESMGWCMNDDDDDDEGCMDWKREPPDHNSSSAHPSPSLPLPPPPQNV